jgi:hypothetical protein
MKNFRFHHTVISCGHICDWLRVNNIEFEMLRSAHGFTTGIGVPEEDASFFKLYWGELVLPYDNFRPCEFPS